MKSIDLTDKLPRVGTTIFTVMSQLAAEHNAINLSQGYPDFDGPTELLDRVNYYLTHGFNQYAPMTGVPRLREQIARKIDKLYGREVCQDQDITITSGATEALFAAISVIIHPGNEAIVFDPAYDSYDPAVTMNGGKTIHIPLQAPNFGIDWQRLEDSINDKTRLIMLNSPHNPTGAIFTETDLNRLAEIIGERDICLVSDEVYEHMVFDGQPHASVLRHPELAERAFVVSSFGKTYHVTGWKIAYCVAPARFSELFRKVHQYLTFTTITPVQHALADFMESCPEHYENLPDFYQAKRDLFCDLMRDTKFQYTPSAGTYFQLADYSALSDMPDTEYVRHLTIDKGVAAIPLSVFYETPPEQQLIRFCFAKDDETLKTAVAILAEL